ncbi:formyltetrahydrofolate deformylase [Blastopirellula marina]|uniref:Formyltetrahydrofolate deformylase n=1 Tax=Blastopirellula marina TaxID=124 RepID=A0A2S8FYC5_9BACT|nr:MULTISPECIES: formyltransferase family protein [Pirellulaceae]PQO37080.1 formyltetrahydrofolate deformylase [Blastopirellula marina]RCS53795.1 formyltetrahydrofolate deformylase [Bremerella cremea]
MLVVITAVGPDNVGLADPIIHYVTGLGANIAEIQMYDHDEEAVFAMFLRVHIDADLYNSLRTALTEIGRLKKLSIRVWSADVRRDCPRIAICTTYRAEPAQAVLEAIAAGDINAIPAVMIGNRDNCKGLAESHGVDWQNIGGEKGEANDEQMIEILDQYDVDYVLLARYMRVLPATSCWKYAGGRIINLHHGLLPSFPGIRPYHDANEVRMLTFGATCHFIVPELDAGNQIIHQETFSVEPGTKIEEILRIGQEVNEPTCLVEGLRRVVAGEVELHFHRVVPRKTHD